MPPFKTKKYIIFDDIVYFGATKKERERKNRNLDKSNIYRKLIGRKKENESITTNLIIINNNINFKI